SVAQLLLSGSLFCGFSALPFHSHRSQQSRFFRPSLPSYSTPPPNMTLLQQVLDVLVQIALTHILRGVVISDDRPAFPLSQTIKGLLSAHSLPCQQAYEVSQEELDVLAREAPRGFVVTLVLGFIHQGVDR